MAETYWPANTLLDVNSAGVAKLGRHVWRLALSDIRARAFPKVTSAAATSKGRAGDPPTSSSSPSATISVASPPGLVEFLALFLGPIANARMFGPARSELL